tara:strand:+ start:1441 stop:2049 length:609 start_codon:yes stop_codon:yes gene_type:complete
MSSILYYSNYCTNCEKLIQKLGKSSIKKDIHFVCIDNRVKENDKVYVKMPNGTKIVLPSNVNKVPALLLLNKQNEVVFGETIHEILQPEFYSETHVNSTQEQFQQSMPEEPMAFSMAGGGSVVSDNYSFLDMSSDDLNAKGNGGVRQLHSYVTINEETSIYTPPDNYVPDKIGADGDVSVENLVEARNTDFAGQQQQQPRQY